MSEISKKQVYKVQCIMGEETESQRLATLGFIPGEELSLVSRMPLGGPVAVNLRGSVWALREHEAQAVVVEPAA